ncbi:hypothetical protein [Nonomuraea jabiensis]|uniref:Uncharacterized protein n=1 Tax=Nonomuraea jabiensis TaxID=882448 RepID=A0A7W9GF92_9ACTN|nr:hypothetical protein [Nonomuraea jabiensis]MBB5782611.1 hypothetical protein [Nonomuraea jabiensis]
MSAGLPWGSARLLRFAGEALPVLDQLPVISRLPGCPAARLPGCPARAGSRG